MDVAASLAIAANGIFGLALVGITGMVMSIINRESDRREHRVRLEHALGRVLSHTPRSRDTRILSNRPLNVLLEATEAGAVFVQRNVEHPTLGLCSTLEREALHQRSRPRPRNLWSLIPWSTLPDAAEDMSSGRPHLYDFDTLTPDMAESLPPVVDPFPNSRSPIIIDGRLVRRDRLQRPWTPTTRGAPATVSLLSTTAQILGTHYQRAAARRRTHRPCHRPRPATGDTRRRSRDARLRC